MSTTDRPGGGKRYWLDGRSLGGRAIVEIKSETHGIREWTRALLKVQDGGIALTLEKKAGNDVTLGDLAGSDFEMRWPLEELLRTADRSMSEKEAKVLAWVYVKANGEITARINLVEEELGIGDLVPIV